MGPRSCAMGGFLPLGVPVSQPPDSEASPLEMGFRAKGYPKGASPAGFQR